MSVLRRLSLPALPAWVVCSPARWLWIVPLTMVPQAFMRMGGALPGFGPDTSAGLLPMPHVLLYYAVFFGFGAVYYMTRDDAGRLSRAWPAQLGLALLVVLPLSLGLSLKLPWASALGGPGLRRVLALLLEPLYAWLMTFGLMGLCRRLLLSQERPWVRYLSDSSYWLYLAHLPLLILGQAALRNSALPALVKFLLLLGVATGALLVVYAKAVRYTWLGRLLNGPRTRPGVAESAGP